jgi:hypothetical protein
MKHPFALIILHPGLPAKFAFPRKVQPPRPQLLVLINGVPLCDPSLYLRLAHAKPRAMTK